MAYRSKPPVLRRVRRSAAHVLGILTLTHAVTACAPGDVLAPPLTPRESASRESARQSPTHELRVLVDPSGDVRAVEFAQIRSHRPGFVPVSDVGKGKRLTNVPAKQVDLARALAERVAALPVAFYEVPKDYKRPKKPSVAQSADLANGGVTQWDPEVDPMSPEAHAEYVTATLEQMSAIMSDALDGGEPGDGDEVFRATPAQQEGEADSSENESAADFSPLSAPIRTFEVVALHNAAPFTAPMRPMTVAELDGDKCHIKRVGFAVAAAAGVVAVAAAGTAFIAATAPVATVIGGITIMVLPSAAATWTAGAIAVGSAFTAGAAVGAARHELRTCLRGGD